MATGTIQKQHSAPTYATVTNLFPNPFPEFPKSNTTASYTFPSDGYVSACFERQSQGQSIWLYIDGHEVGYYPAHVAPYTVTPGFPVRKGQVLTIKTDSTSNSWITRFIKFYPN